MNDILRFLVRYSAVRILNYSVRIIRIEEVKKRDEHTYKHQIITKDGTPLFVLVPHQEYIASHQRQEEVYFTHAVVERYAVQGKSLVRDWREHKGYSQKELA